MTIRLLLVTVLVGCSAAAPVSDGGPTDDAASVYDGPDAPPFAAGFAPCDGCIPSCVAGEPACVHEPGIEDRDCAACLALCGDYLTPRDAPVACTDASTAPRCPGEQALFCFRALP